MTSGPQGANTDSLETASPKGASYYSPGQRPMNAKISVVSQSVLAREAGGVV